MQEIFQIILEILFGVEPIKILQSLHPTFDSIFLFFTQLGEDYVFTALIGITYWCINKEVAIITFYVLISSGYLHYFLKMALRMERPPSFYRIIGKEELSYGFPSGHTQNVATFWSWAWLKIRKNWFAIISIIIIFFVGLSRIYLGVHYLGDVIGGAIIGILFSIFSFKLSQVKIKKIKDPYSLLLKITPILAIFLFFFSLLIFPDIKRDDPSVQLGSLFGLPIGIMLEKRYINFSTNVNLKRKILRAIIGFGLVMILMVTLSPLLPSKIVYLRFTRYAIISLTAAFIVPLIFKIIEK
jgi:membrane-associated phospholipid phosphatase